MNQALRPAGIRSTDIEKTVRAVLQGGAQVHRVTVNIGEGKIVIDTTADPDGPRSFDALDFKK